MPKRKYLMVECFLCGRSFEFGPSLYKGRHIGAWGISVCQGCASSPYREVPPIYTERIVTYLESKGIPYVRNAQGWICWP